MDTQQTSSYSRSFLSLLLLALSLSHFVLPVAADGIGLIGAGKWMYRPACAHACRRPIASNELTCNPEIGDDHAPHSHTRRAHNHGPLNTAECYLNDAAFLRTMALCIADRCPRENAPVSVIEDYWEGHLATGSVGDWSLRPRMSYQEALRHALMDVEQVGGMDKVPFSVTGAPLNVTSLIKEDIYESTLKSIIWFEKIETGHSRNSIGAAVSSVLIPILFSLLRFLPGNPRWYSRLNNILEKPLFRSNPNLKATIPTRGQTLYIVYLIITQIFLAVFPHPSMYPNASAPTEREGLIIMIGNRTGSLAMADFLALFLFSSRNNVLLWITNWSHSTYLLLHRWIAYCMIVQVCLHSLILLVSYWDVRDTEMVQVYWIWGIVGTLSFVLIWPASLNPVRHKAYEFFLAWHQLFSALGLIATFYHIFELYTYNWGYEIWVYIAGSIWFFDRFLRILRMVSMGYRRAVVTFVDDTAEYIRVDIDGAVTEGHVYLYFPTLTWRVWENHPYSILSSFTPAFTQDSNAIEDEKNPSTPSVSSVPSSNQSTRPRTTILLRPMSGITRLLARRVLASSSLSISIPVFIEGSYHSNAATIQKLAECSTIIVFAGGVGITAVVPILKTYGDVQSRLYWGMRNDVLLLDSTVDAEIRGLKKRGVEVQTSVGARLDVAEIIREELDKGEEGDGDIGIVVCGPTGMAENVRIAVGELGPKARRGVLLVDEAFNW
ncbi:metalloreductase [Panaeolus papilionaceus]|nr:metalloreductase [Panaeolus papilionaceus]